MFKSRARFVIALISQENCVYGSKFICR